MKLVSILLVSGLALTLGACSASEGTDPIEETGGGGAATTSTSRPTADTRPVETPETPMTLPDKAVAYFGAGCFWCVEAVYEQLDGVLDVKSGFMGGTVPNPTYKQVCTGETGHNEIVRVEYDPAKVSYETLLDWFWRLHDPTTLNRQGADVGTQYRSGIYFVDEAQRTAAEASKKAQDASGTFDDPIVTEIVKATEFYEAEEYHDDYYRQNKTQGYCRVVIRPKLKKLGLDH